MTRAIFGYIRRVAASGGAVDDEVALLANVGQQPLVLPLGIEAVDQAHFDARGGDAGDRVSGASADGAGLQADDGEGRPVVLHLDPAVGMLGLREAELLEQLLVDVGDLVDGPALGRRQRHHAVVEVLDGDVARSSFIDASSFASAMAGSVTKFP